MRPDPGSGGGSFALLSFEPGWVGSWWKEEGSGPWVGLSHAEDLAPVRWGMQLGQGCMLPSPCENAGWVQGTEMMLLEGGALA